MAFVRSLANVESVGVRGCQSIGAITTRGECAWPSSARGEATLTDIPTTARRMIHDPFTPSFMKQNLDEPTLPRWRGTHSPEILRSRLDHPDSASMCARD